MKAGMAGKWLGLLTEIAPDVKRVAVMFDSDMALTDQGRSVLDALIRKARPG
jgi:hypothetical protein